jgi:putative addiction module component (TIGR02574 family)
MGEMSISELLKLPVAERIKLVAAIWDSIAAAPETLHLTDAERDELDRRWKAYERDPSLGSPWADVRARIQRNG